MFRFTYTPMGGGQEGGKLLKIYKFFETFIFRLVCLCGSYTWKNRYRYSSMHPAFSEQFIRKVSNESTNKKTRASSWNHHQTFCLSIRYKMLRVAWNTFFAVHLSICRKVNHFYFKHTISHFVAHTHRELARGSAIPYFTVGFFLDYLVSTPVFHWQIFVFPCTTRWNDGIWEAAKIHKTFYSLWKARQKTIWFSFSIYIYYEALTYMCHIISFINGHDEFFFCVCYGRIWI